MKIVVATGNEHKVREMTEILSGPGDSLISMKEAGLSCDIVEDGETFEDNALIKARAVADEAKRRGMEAVVLADDSGLAIDIMNGAPGVHSARFMGEDTPYEEKNAEILKQLSIIDKSARTARFVCAMAAVLPDGREIVLRRTMEGEIAYESAGSNGFGYDPIFFLPEYGCTSAQLSPEEKNAISHRGKALRAMKEELEGAMRLGSSDDIVETMVNKLKTTAPALAATDGALRNKALLEIKKALEQHKAAAFFANQKDLDRADKEGVSEAVRARLKFDEAKLRACIDGIETLVELEDPIGKVQLHRQLDDGLILTRVSVPIGVIGVIFEARPDALVQIATLCIKSGNCAVLKGGKETAETNRVLFEIIEHAVTEAGLPGPALMQVTAHEEIDALLRCEKDVDLLIPRGSNAFVRYIMEHTKIPVMGHADGICHTYVDKEADLDKAIPILVDAKTQYPAACNATETVLLHRSIADSAKERIVEAFSDAGVTVHDEAFATEYLALEVSVKVVADVDEAILHINQYGSHHTDAIITENKETAAYFMRMVDSAGVYHNASTRFADGFRYGFGAEVGISTSKIHARGPVGLDGLMTYKYMLEGDGHIVADYASGMRAFCFKDD